MKRFLSCSLALSGVLLLAACDTSFTPATEYPDKDSPAFDVYARNCSPCHAPPHPEAHTAAEWPNVIERMQTHLVQRSMAPITPADVAVLRGYLESHAVDR